jgi:hypothetical protein
VLNHAENADASSLSSGKLLGREIATVSAVFTPNAVPLISESMDPFSELSKFALERDEGEDNSENPRFDSLYIINSMDYMSRKRLSGTTRDCMG